MTEQEINIAIAEFCGWEIYWNERTTKQWVCRNPKGDIIACDEEPITDTRIAKVSFAHLLPNYHSNLNAIHEAEKLLTYEQHCDMANNLENGFIISGPAAYKSFFATSQQRCEALLRTIGKWKD